MTRMVALLDDLHASVNLERSFGASGSPWEFNLRDLLRWCQLVTDSLAKAAERSRTLFSCLLK